jgi:isoleucyl-tRNA synthetase
MKSSLQPFSNAVETDIHAFWEKEKIAQQVRSASAKNAQTFYFMDGPPYATGYIHMGTALNKISKDVIIRSKRMQGFHVYDRPGYDTHGVPIESKIEQKHNFKLK